MTKKSQEFKEKFIERYSKLTDFDKFKEFSIKEQRKSIRVNPIKISLKKFKEDFKELNLKQIPWCKEGFFIDYERTDLGNLFPYSMGYYYVQEASSMIPVEVLNPSKDDFVLDMAAAPGSKTTQLASKMNNEGLIVANDNDYNRLKALTMNLQRSGITNTVVSLMQARFFKNFTFDKILLDAPCSGTGTIRKSPNTILDWSPNLVKSVAGTQRQLIKVAFENLKVGGTLVYSTCTMEPEEDEGVISYLLDEFDNVKLEKFDLDIKRSNPILEFENKSFSPEVKKCLRIWPQDNDTDGFFVTKIRKL